MIWEISVALVSLVLILLMAYTIPMIIQLKGTLAQYGSLAQKVEENIDPLMERVEQITDLLEDLGETVEGELAEIDQIIHQVHNIVDNVSGLTHQLKEPGGAISKVKSGTNLLSALLMGFKIFNEIFSHRRKR